MMSATARVQVPVGVNHGQQLRVRGAGHISPHGGGTGDLIVEVEIVPHEVFERQERDLIAYMDAPFDVLALGGELVVPLLEGGEAKVKVPPGLQPGKALRLKGKGLFALGESQRGDLLVFIEVSVPKVVTAAERKLLVALRTLRTGDDLENRETSRRDEHHQPSLTLTQRLRSWFAR